MSGYAALTDRWEIAAGTVRPIPATSWSDSTGPGTYPSRESAQAALDVLTAFKARNGRAS